MGLLSPQLSSKEMALMCRELATTYSAGISMLKALELAAQHCGSGKVRHMLERMESGIRNGSTLGGVARAEKRLLPNMFIEVIAAGEVGGRLDELLLELAGYYESMWKMWRSVLAAMAYPMLQLFSAWFLGTFAIGLVGKISPTSTQRFVMREYIANYISFQSLAILIAVACAALFIFLGRAGMLKTPWAMLKMVIWPVRHITNKFAMARFFRTMALLIGSGLNMRLCIERSAAVTLDPLIERDLLRAVPVVMKGGTLVEAFSGCRYISRVGREMIAVGEQSGRLDATLRKVAEYHYSEAQTAVNIGTKVLFVATILIMGVIVGGIVIYFYAGLYGSILNDI